MLLERFKARGDEAVLYGGGDGLAGVGYELYRVLLKAEALHLVESVRDLDGPLDIVDHGWLAFGEGVAGRDAFGVDVVFFALMPGGLGMITDLTKSPPSRNLVAIQSLLFLI